MAAILKHLITEGEAGERRCAISSIKSIISAMDFMHKVNIYNPNRICKNNICHPCDAIYHNIDKIFVPEIIVSELLSRETYLSVEAMVDILSKSRYNDKEIIPQNFYHVLHVHTPVEQEDVDCLVFNRAVILRIANDLDF